MAHIHFDTETLIKALRCLQGQVTLILNRSADVIRKSAVGVRNKTGTLKDYDFSFLVKPAYSCRPPCPPRRPRKTPPATPPIITTFIYLTTFPRYDRMPPISSTFVYPILFRMLVACALRAPLLQCTKSGVLLSFMIDSTCSMLCRGIFLLPSICPSEYSSRVRTSKSTAPSVERKLLTPLFISFVCKKLKNPISHLTA